MKTECANETDASPTRDDEELARLANALGHPARVAIVRLLSRRGTCVCGEIVDELPLAQSTVSQHLKVLREAGWVVARATGPCTCFFLDRSTFERFSALVSSSLPGAVSGDGADQLHDCVPAPGDAWSVGND